jgi:hypothetical protein
MEEKGGCGCWYKSLLEGDDEESGMGLWDLAYLVKWLSTKNTQCR